MRKKLHKRRYFLKTNCQQLCARIPKRKGYECSEDNGDKINPGRFFDADVIESEEQEMLKDEG